MTEIERIQKVVEDISLRATIRRDGLGDRMDCDAENDLDAALAAVRDALRAAKIERKACEMICERMAFLAPQGGLSEALLCAAEIRRRG